MKPDENEPEKGAAAQDGEHRTDPNTPGPIMDRAARERLRGLDATDASNALEALRTEVCAYFGDRCDCKHTRPPEAFRPFKRSERGTGCPELRVAIGVVNALPLLLDALDAAEARAERAEGERDAEAVHYEKAQRAYAQSLERALTAESTLAALRAEVEGLRARVASGLVFGVADRYLIKKCVYANGSVEWIVHGVLRGFPDAHATLDAAWAAAEAAAKKEGNAHA